MDKQEATKLIAVKLSIAEHALKEARLVADEAGVEFTFSLGSADNVERDIGGQYYGKNMQLYEDGLYAITCEWGPSDHYEHIGDEEINRTYMMGKYRLNRGAWSAWTSSGELC